MTHPSTTLSIVALALVLPLALAAEAPPPLSCSMVALSPRVLPGEWFIVRFVVRNAGGSSVRVVGIDSWGLHKVRSRRVGEEWRDWGGWPPEGDEIPSGDPSFAEMKPGEAIEKVHILTPSWRHYPPGRFEVQLLIKYHPWPSFTKPPAGAWAGVLECTPARVEVVAPTGVDAQVFEALGPFPLSSDRREILRSFAASCYAGYALLAGVGVGSGRAIQAVVDRDQYLRDVARSTESDRPYLQASVTRLRDDCELESSALRTFLTAHPDFPLATWLRLKQAGLLAYFERYEEARTLAKKALLEEEDPIRKREAQKLLDLMVEKGYLKPE